MQGKTSRAGVFAGLQPRQWVVLFEREDSVLDPVYNNRITEIFFQADHLNQGNVEVIIQDSPDGVTWTNRYVMPSAIVPNGEIGVYMVHQQRWVRVCLYSTGSGRVDATVNIPEDQVIPGLWPDVHSLSCVSYCEVSDES